MTNVEDNKVAWTKPKGYDARQYELLFRAIEAGEYGDTVRMDEVLKPDMMPDLKTDTNNRGPFSTDNIGMNHDYPEASYAERERIVEEHLRYQKGLMWTLAHHPRTPKELREEVQQWGLAADEFEDNGHWPHKIYVREARRMVGRYVMTEHDCRRTVDTPEPVGLGSYTMDSHNTQRFITEDGYVQNEGDIGVHPGGPYEIAYGSLVPKKQECENLLVSAAVSASHIAYGSIRMEPVFMVLGQSAGTAAVHAIEEGVAVQDVDYSDLRERLLADGQRIETDAPPQPAPKRIGELDGLVMDDQEADAQGAWPNSRSVPPFLEDGYRHDDNAQKGEKRITYRLNVPKAGRYELRLNYSPHHNRATNVPVTIPHADGTDTVRVNQREELPEDETLETIGTYRFEKGEAVVVISNEGTDGYVIADAVQLLPKE